MVFLTDVMFVHKGSHNNKLHKVTAELKNTNLLQTELQWMDASVDEQADIIQN